jgi:hypothetical protein
MAFGPEAESLPNDEGWAELVRGIQARDQAAIRKFHSMFSAGIASLLRRKLEKLTVLAEVAEVLQAAVQDVQAISPGQSVNLPHLVARIMRAHFPSTGCKVESWPLDSSGETLARSIIADRTPLEQAILRRYYVLGESPDTIRRGLRVSSRIIEHTIASARADFRRKSQRSGWV